MSPLEWLDWTYKQKVAPAGVKSVLSALAEHTDAGGHCCPSQASLAEMTGQGRSTVQRHLAALDAGGLIRSEHRHGAGGHHRANNAYLLLPCLAIERDGEGPR